MGFIKNFIWGFATSSYQIEGAWNEDGKGLSVWDVFCKKKDAIWNQQTGNIACDHYHRYKDDIKLMKEIGVNAYRFSVSWPRILAEGTGKVNNKGLDFYDKLVDELINNNIKPCINLFHWDYHYELYKKGGWLNDDSSKWFEEFVEVLVNKFYDRVKIWMTINEPQIIIKLGHYEAKHAPGDKLQFFQLNQIAHNILLSHGKSVKIIKDKAKDCLVGTAVVLNSCVPVDDDIKNIEAARDAMFGTDGINITNISWWLSPIIFGKYPVNSVDIVGKDYPIIKDNDMKTINQEIDFIGLNTYFGNYYLQGNNGLPEKVPFKNGHPITALKWYIIPDSLYWVSKFCYERYKKPILITENGLSNTDWIALDGKVHDPQRIDYTARHLIGLKKANDEGIKIIGYLHWSFMDNFEWAEGYKERFGMVYVDFQTQKRLLKDSAYWYRDVIKSNGEIL